jgi:hypothetical protein
LTTLQRAGSYTSFPSLPAKIWAFPWVPEAPSLPGFSIDELSASVFSTASIGARNEKLEVSGTDVETMAGVFKQMLADAGEAGDFTSILSRDRSFQMYVKLCTI